MFIPVPVSWTVCGLPAALSLLTNWPVRDPAATGLNAKPPVTLDPAAIVKGLDKVVAESKLNSGELKLKFEIRDPVPVLLICSGAKKGGGTLNTGVETPTATGPMSIDVGFTLNTGVPCRAIVRAETTHRKTVTKIVKMVFIRMLLAFQKN
jgi:hypothetical protein